MEEITKVTYWAPRMAYHCHLVITVSTCELWPVPSNLLTACG